MKSSAVVLSALVAVSAVPAAAQIQPVLMVDPKSTKVSSVDRMDEILENVANTVTVITRQEIELRQQPFVSDVLRSVPGLDVVQAGSRGGTTSVFIRGMDSDHTLVLLDGVQLNDPSNPTRAYDIANLTTDNVERIEILRGPQSVMYGSDAMGGVVNIITKKGEGPFKAVLSGEGGSYGTWLARGDVSGSSKLVDYSFGASRYHTDGIPSAGSDYGATFNDGYKNAVVSGAVGIKPAENFRLDLNARNTYSFYNLPEGGGGAGADTPYNTGRFNETDLSARGTLTLLDGRLIQKAGVGVVTATRKFIDNPWPASPTDPTASSNSSSYGQTLKLTYQAIAKLHELNTLTAGFDYRREAAHTMYSSQGMFGPFVSNFDDQKNFNKGVFVEDLARLNDRFFASIGGRVDRIYNYGNVYTYRVSPTYLIPETRTKLKGTVGTGFKAPSLFQAYSPQLIVPNLSPEHSVGYDAGVEQELWKGRVSIGATYFRNYIRDLIDYLNNPNPPFIGNYYNVGHAQTEGYELTTQVRPSERVAIRGNYTYTSAKNLETGAALLRRPRIKFGGDLELHPVPAATILVGMTYTGPRYDTYFPPGFAPSQPVTLGGFALWNFSGSYRLCKGLELTGRVDNMLDKRYEQVAGYGSLGIGGYGGVKLTF